MSEAIHLPCPDEQNHKGVKVPCPDPECDAWHAYSWDEDKGVGGCFSCGYRTWRYNGKMYGATEHGKGKPLGSTDKAFDTNASDVSGVVDVQDFTPKNITEDKGTFVGMRGITSSTMEKFNVKTDGDKQHYVYPSGGVKTRYISTKDFSASNLRSDELFGMNLFAVNASRIVTITEGELDAMSAWQMLSQGSTYVNPVVSLPSATPSGKLWEKCKGWLDSFEKIILSVDNDDAGRKVAERISLMFPRKVFVMNHGDYKDANDFLQAGDQKAYKGAWWGAKPYRPDDMLVDADDYLNLFDESPDFEYFTTGIPELDEKILGINKGYFTVIQAPTGVGKTEVMRYLEYRCLTTSNYKFAYMHLEESKLRSVLGLVSYDLNDNLTLKKFIDEKGREEEVRESISKLTGGERMLQFSFHAEDGYEVLLDKIKYMKAAFDIDYVFFEPIQDLVHGEDKEGKLADLSSRLGTMASDLDVGIVTIAHQNQNGDTMYATMIGKKAAFEILLERDQEAEDFQERNRTKVKVGRKNRVGLGNGPAGALDFDVDTYTLKVVHGPQEPKTENTNDF